MSCCLKCYPTCSLNTKYESAHLECPLLLPKSLLVFVDVRLSDVISMELHICPVVEEVRHPVHVAAGGVQEGDLVLVEDLLEVVSHRVEGADHSPGGRPGAARPTL